MMKKLLLVTITAAVAIPLHAAETIMKMPSSTAQIQTTVQCPEHLANWPYEQINIHDCNIPGINVYNLCQKINSGQAKVPDGWQYFDNGSYSTTSHLVLSHAINTSNNKTYLYCNYAMNRGTPQYVTHTIRQEAPSGMICTKGANYSFTCTPKSRKKFQAIPR